MSNNTEGQRELKLTGGQQAPVLNYNVPEPTTYSGRTYIELDIADDCFVPYENVAASKAATAALQRGSATLSGTASPSPLEELRKVQASGERMTARLAELTEAEAERQIAQGKRLQLFRTMTGAWSFRFAMKPAEAGAEPSAQRAALHMTAAPIGQGGITPPIYDNGELRKDDDDGPFPEPRPDDFVDIAINFTAPVANANLNGPHTGVVLDIKGTAVANRGLVKSVTVKIGSGAWQKVQLTGTTWVLAGAVIKEQGEVTLQAHAVHSDGISAFLSTRKVNVTLAQAPDVIPPSIKITSPAAGAILSTKKGSAATVTVTGTAGDDRLVKRVELLQKDGSWLTATTTNQYATWSGTMILEPGNHDIIARCFDAADNKSEASLNIGIDATLPSISIVSPKKDTPVAGTYTKGAVIEVTGIASDDRGIKVVELSVNNSPVYVRAMERAPGDWSQWKSTFKVEQPGPCLIRARATDLAGNTMEAETSVAVSIIPEVSSRQNRIILIESYRLSSFLADYGAGRTLKTFSLLPGEKSKISIRTYSQREETMKSTSTILDSVTDDIAHEFEQSIGEEASNKTGYESSNDYKLAASVGVSWGGWLNASASASTSGATNAAREQLTKNIVNSTQKHVSRASARRDMQIDTTYEVKERTEEETAIVREIENVNMSRTLNFVFRQMNQSYVTLLHLVDIRIGFYRTELVEGQGNSYYEEVTLPELDRLLASIIVPEKREEIKNTIIFQLMNIFDYQDYRHAFVEEAVMKDEKGEVIPLSNYLRVKKDYFSEYRNDDTGMTIKVPGIILAANNHVLRTDGIVVDAVLGKGEALDEYSSKLQHQSVRERELKNDMMATEVRMRELALHILESKDSTAAQLYALLNPQPASADEEQSETAAALRV